MIISYEKSTIFKTMMNCHYLSLVDKDVNNSSDFSHFFNEFSSCYLSI